VPIPQRSSLISQVIKKTTTISAKTRFKAVAIEVNSSKITRVRFRIRTVLINKRMINLIDIGREFRETTSATRKDKIMSRMNSQKTPED
jgi:hypothetical protein